MKTNKFPSGTHLVGYVKTSYAKLVETFGEPSDRMGDKTSVEWWLDIEGERCTVYDYKFSCPQNDEEFSFHVGGDRGMAVVKVNKALGLWP